MLYCGHVGYIPEYEYAIGKEEKLYPSWVKLENYTSSQEFLDTWWKNLKRKNKKNK